MNLVFWDPKIIIDIARKTPHLIERDPHQCNCEYCTHDPDEAWECSKCWYEVTYTNTFPKRKWWRTCPKCDAELISEYEYNALVSAKERQFHSAK